MTRSETPESRYSYALGIALNVLAVLIGVAVLGGYAIALISYFGHQYDWIFQKPFSAIWAVLGVAIPAMALVLSRRLLRRIFGN
jgi:hypothetical protein